MNSCRGEKMNRWIFLGVNRLVHKYMNRWKILKVLANE